MQPYEFKTVKYIPKTKMLMPHFKEDGLDELMNKLGKVGWNLISTSEIASGGTTKELLLFFSRPAETLEEMV